MIYWDVLRSVVIFGSTPKSNFWHIFDVFSDIVRNAHFCTISFNNSINVWFYAIIYCIFIIVMLLNALKYILCYIFIFFNFYEFFFLCEKGGGGVNIFSDLVSTAKFCTISFEYLNDFFYAIIYWIFIILSNSMVWYNFNSQI